MLGDELEREIDRESEGVVQEKGVGRGDALGVAPASAVDQLVEPLESLLERPSEALLLRLEPPAHEVAFDEELGILAAHQLRDHVRVTPQEARAQLERAALLDRATHDAPQDVAAVLVGGDHAVGDQERHRAAVVGEQTQRTVGRYSWP